MPHIWIRANLRSSWTSMNLFLRTSETPVTINVMQNLYEATLANIQWNFSRSVRSTNKMFQRIHGWIRLTPTRTFLVSKLTRNCHFSFIRENKWINSPSENINFLSLFENALEISTNRCCINSTVLSKQVFFLINWKLQGYSVFLVMNLT